MCDGIKMCWLLDTQELCRSLARSGMRRPTLPSSTAACSIWTYWFGGGTTSSYASSTCGSNPLPQTNQITQICCATGSTGEYVGGISITYKGGCKQNWNSPTNCLNLADGDYVTYVSVSAPGSLLLRALLNLLGSSAGTVPEAPGGLVGLPAAEAPPLQHPLRGPSRWRLIQLGTSAGYQMAERPRR